MEGSQGSELRVPPLRLAGARVKASKPKYHSKPHAAEQARPGELQKTV
jgi:hypothetical protein